MRTQAPEVSHARGLRDMRTQGHDRTQGHEDSGTRGLTRPRTQGHEDSGT